ncbi:MAG TPA: hypothetical protein PLW93_04870 [Candidatus Absconditabacterales bacterium]|nr:hypothetical protein [Candidatus Absconditabacterales bacterium]HNG97575.1 hypothetical protein [Candidatus Absconditabacterales bacterium]
MSGNKLKLTTLGSIHDPKNNASSITGSAHLLDVFLDDQNHRLLIDLGMIQGTKDDMMLNQTLPVDPTTGEQLDPKTVQSMILTHTHNDHSGRLPMMVKQGYEGPIYMTQQSYDILEHILQDSLYVQTSELERFVSQQKTIKKNIVHNLNNPHFLGAQRNNKTIQQLFGSIPRHEPLFSEHDIAQSIQQSQGKQYGQYGKNIFNVFNTHNAITAQFVDAQHIFGSAMTLITIKHSQGVYRILRGGDIGRFENNLNQNTYPTLGSLGNIPLDLIAVETTYGGRNHPDIMGQVSILQDTITQTFKRNGSVLIPLFTQTRFQDMVVLIQHMIRHQQIPSNTQIIACSPLGQTLGNSMSNHDHVYTKIFDGPIQRVSTSEALSLFKTGGTNQIFLMSGGMLQGGTAMSLIHYCDRTNKGGLEDFDQEKADRSSVIITGYVPEHSLGHRVIHTRDFNGSQLSFSSHIDHDGIIKFITNYQNKSNVRLKSDGHVYLMHGSHDSMNAIKQGLISSGLQDQQIIIPPHNGYTHEFIL